MQPVIQTLQPGQRGKTAMRRTRLRPEAEQKIGALASVAFVFLSLLLFCNVNGIVAMIWEINRAASAFIAAFSLLALALLAPYVMPSLRAGGGLLLAFYFLYTSLGAAVAFRSPFVSTEAIAGRVLSYAASVLVILTYAAYGYLLIRSGKKGVELMRLLFFISCISTLSVLIGLVYPAWTEITKSKVAVEGRLSGFWSNPNEAGLQAALTIVVGTFVSLRTGRIWYFAVAVISAGIASFYSFSKTAILMSMVVSIAMAFLIQRRGISLRNALALIVSAMLVLMLISFVRGAAMRSESRIDLTSGQIRRLEQVYAVMFEGRLDEETTTGRTLLAQEGIEMWRISPLVGNGLTTLDRLPSSGLGPHNTFIKVLGEGGVVCLVLMLAALARIALHALRVGSASAQAFIVGGLLVLNGAFMVSHNVLDDRNHNALMGLLCGVGAGAPLVVRRKQRVPTAVSLQPPPSYRPVHVAR